MTKTERTWFGCQSNSKIRSANGLMNYMNVVGAEMGMTWKTGSRRSQNLAEAWLSDGLPPPWVSHAAYPGRKGLSKTDWARYSLNDIWGSMW